LGGVLRKEGRRKAKKVQGKKKKQQKKTKKRTQWRALRKKTRKNDGLNRGTPFHARMFYHNGQERFKGGKSRKKFVRKNPQGGRDLKSKRQV